MSLFVSMHFRYKPDKNANLTMQICEWVFISAFFLLLPHLTPKDFTLFISMLCDYATHSLNDK